MKLKVSIALLFSSVMFTALPVEAVSFHSQWDASRRNDAGVTVKVTNATTANHFCVLSGVAFEETDANNEYAECSLRRRGLVWVLEARLGRSSDADVSCRAMCYNN
jgi:hypothetical protein